MLAYKDTSADYYEAEGRQMADHSKLGAYQAAGQDENYARVPKPGIPTYTEAWALIEAARRMAVASDHAILDNIEDRNKVRDAVRLNWRLWTIFQAEMTVDDENAIPDEIRVNMLTLCKFVDQHTIATMQDPSPEKIGTLIEINRNIAAGLLESLKMLEQENADTTVEKETPDDGGPDTPRVTNIAT